MYAPSKRPEAAARQMGSHWGLRRQSFETEFASFPKSLMCVLAPVRNFRLLCFVGVVRDSDCGAEPVRSGRPLGDSMLTSTLPSRGQSEIFLTSRVTFSEVFGVTLRGPGFTMGMTLTM